MEEAVGNDPDGFPSQTLLVLSTQRTQSKQDEEEKVVKNNSMASICGKRHPFGVFEDPSALARPNAH